MTHRMGNHLAIIIFILGALAENPRHRAENPVPVGPPGSEPLAEDASDIRPTQWNPDPQGWIRGANSPGTAVEPLVKLPPQGEPGEVDPCAQKNPVSALEAIPEILQPTAAPQGGVFFLGRQKDVAQVYYLKSPRDLPEPRTRFDRGVTQYAVSPDGGRLLTLRSPDGTRRWQLDLISRKYPEGLTLSASNERVESMIWMKPKEMAYTTTTDDGKLWKLVVRPLEESPRTLGAFTQPIVVTDTARDGSSLLLARLLSGGQHEIQVWDLKTNQAIPPKIIASVPTARFSADGKGVFVLSDRGRGPVRLYHYDRETGGELRLISPKSEPVDHLALNSDRSHLYYTTVKHGYHRPKGLTIDPRGRTRKGAPAPPPGDWVLEGMGPAKESLFFVRSNARHSPNLWQWADRKLTQWTQAHRPLLFPQCISMPEYVEYPGQDALPIPAFLYRPTGGSGKMIVRLPRFAGEGFLPAFHREILYLTQRGYGVLAPNLRGAPYGSRKFRDLDNGPGRLKAVGDVVAAAEWINQRRLSPPGNVGLFGTHYGGTLALLALQQKDSLFMGAFVGEPVLELDEFVGRAPAAERPALQNEFGLTQGTPWGASLSPKAGLGKTKKPLLAFEGGVIQKSSPKTHSNREFLKPNPPPFEGAAVPTQVLKWAQRAAFGIFQDKKGKGP